MCTDASRRWPSTITCAIAPTGAVSFSPAAAASLVDFWDFAVGVTGDQPAVRLRSVGEGASGRDLLEIVQQDRPFLVDSVMVFIVRRKITANEASASSLAAPTGTAPKSHSPHQPVIGLTGAGLARGGEHGTHRGPQGSYRQ